MSLLSTPLLQVAYNEAKAHDIEHTASSFWQTVLQGVFPQPENYSVTCEVAPDDSRRRVDIVVKHLTDDFQYYITVLFCEVKRKGVGELRAVEDQGLDAAKRYILAQKVSGAYVMTAWGTTARLWFVSAERMILEPMFGKPEMAARAEYIEAHSTNARLIPDAFAQIRDGHQSTNINRLING